MSQINREPLRTTYWVVQIGSRLARFACGTKRKTLLSAASDRRGAARAPVAATAAVLRKQRRSIFNTIPAYTFAFALDPSGTLATLPEYGAKHHRGCEGRCAFLRGQCLFFR